MSQQPDLSREQRLWTQGYTHIAGLDEAGRGAWAGPVVAAACILPPNAPDLALWLAPVRDSKLLTPHRREVCYDLIRQHALAYGVGQVSAEEIDCIGILPATRLAMQQALEALAIPPDHLLIDAVRLTQVPLPQQAIIKGDRDCLSIAAASIIAKVTRDRGMIALAEHLPGYGLAQHKGYGTRAHLAALQTLGTTPQHRHTFAPIRDLDRSQRGHEAQDD
jgi:ribonuclease HII